MPTLITPAGRTTFAEVERRARAHARQARALGVRPGDRVALKAGNSAAWLSWLLGLAHLGASIVLVDPRTPHAPTARRLSATGADVLVTDAPGPWSGRLLDLDAVPAPDPADGDPAGPEPGAGLDLARWTAMPDALVMASGGSTGDPKPVAKSGHGFLANLEANIEAMGHRADDVFWPALPLAHQYGLGMAVIAWRLGADLVLCPPERPDVGLRLAAAARPTVVDATPATWRAVLALAARRAEFDRGLDRVRLPCSGASALPPALAEQARERFGVPLLDSYGSTELGNLTFATPERPVGCGRPVRGVRVEARAADGARLGPGELGEIVVACENAMTGYLLDDGLQPPARTDDGWHRTGDLGMVDETGALHVVGRAEVLHRAGRPVHPAAVEHLLRQAGAPGAVVVLPDHDRSRLVCFAEARSPGQRAAVRALVARHCTGHLGVDELRLLAAVPANLNGKPDRAALARQLDPATRGRDAS